MSMEIRLPDYILRIMERYKAAGEEIYLVGGSLRDLLLGNEPHDYDLATSASPKQTVALFSDLRVIETGIKHGTVTVLMDHHPVEITTFRIDGSYADSRHPDCVTFTRRIKEDLSRRDFTVNAMAYHPSNGLVDPFGGQQDLKEGILRAVGDPNLRFQEDSLRIMRAFRFAAQLNFIIHPETLKGCIDSKYRLTNIAKERIASEFLRLLLSDFPSKPLRQMIENGILEFITTNYYPSRKTIEGLTSMPKEDIARLGLFFSDTDRETAVGLMRELKLSNKQITGSAAILTGSACSVHTPAEGRQLIAFCGVYAPVAVRASVLRGNSPKEAILWVDENRAPCKIADLAVSGRDLAEIGIRGKDLGITLEKLLAMVLEHPEINQKEALLSLARVINGMK